jgi:biopolymer transport protein ExbD
MKKARIEIIPMIDTIFFLLVFFMITSLSMVQMSAHKVTLPTSSTASEKPIEKVVVSISREGNFYVDRQQVAFTAIEPYLEDKIRENPAIVVVLNCDKDQDVSTFLRVMDVAKQANPASLLIATAPKDARGGN